MSSIHKRERIEEAMRKFFAGEDIDTDSIRSEILDSWIRSRQYGVNPVLTRKIVLTPVELKERIERRQHLYQTSLPMMESLYSFIRGSNFIVLLCDEDGYVLKVLGDDQMLKQAESSQLVEGAGRSEKHLGTNGIGTCIYLKKPLQVWAEEHYYQPHRNWTCSAAPILDQTSGEVLGVLCLSGSWDQVHFHTLGMVVAGSEAITRQLSLTRLLTESNTTNEKLNKVMESLNYGVVFTDCKGVVKQINSTALSLLNVKNLDKDSILERNIQDFLQGNGLGKSILKDAESGAELEFSTAYGTLQCTVNRMDGGREGPSDFVITLRGLEHVRRMVNRIVGSNAHFVFGDIVGGSLPIIEAKKLAKIASSYSNNVLLTGESGTGKELFAQAIHNASSRASGPFVAINCGALPRSLVESELFGYEGGTFTGSKKTGQPGKFELANGGTIFLDEIGEMPFDVQVSLLRVLQNREVIRVGAKMAIEIDVRVIAATNKDLEESIRNRTMREDLYYRLNAFSIKIPALRERGDDILTLAEFLLRKYNLSFNKSVAGFSSEARRILCNYDWPGNVRELENIIECAILIADTHEITPAQLPAHLASSVIQASRTDTPATMPSGITSAESEELLIRSTINAHRGNVSKTAKELGLGRSTIYRKIKKYGITVPEFRD